MLFNDFVGVMCEGKLHERTFANPDKDPKAVCAAIDFAQYLKDQGKSAVYVVRVTEIARPRE